MDPKILLKKNERTGYFNKNYPQHSEELQLFAKSLDRLVIFVISGFVLILFSFLYLYFNQ